MKKIILSALLACLVSTKVFAGLDEGLAAYKAGNYSLALKEFSNLAKKGDVQGQYNLGVMYEKGHGVPQDYTKAASWYRKAAEQRDARGQYNLGLLYSNGQGLPQDYAQAMSWYRKAAEQGIPIAQNNLGLMYYNGQGVKKDYTQAANWYQKAAEQGNALAQNNLAVMFYFGQVVPKNKVVAYALFSLAALDPATNGAKGRSVIMTEMTPKQIEAGQRLTTEMAKPNNMTIAMAEYLTKFK